MTMPRFGGRAEERPGRRAKERPGGRAETDGGERGIRKKIYALQRGVALATLGALKRSSGVASTNHAKYLRNFRSNATSGGASTIHTRYFATSNERSYRGQIILSTQASARKTDHLQSVKPGFLYSLKFNNNEINSIHKMTQ